MGKAKSNMTVMQLCRAMMEREPDAHAIVLAPDLYDRLEDELVGDLPEDEKVGCSFYVEGFGTAILLDIALAPGTAEYITWPDCLALEELHREGFDKEPRKEMP
jgi:hypothetical protein